MKLVLLGCAMATGIAVAMVAPSCRPTHHECDLETYPSRCEGNELFACWDHEPNQPCTVNVGCDTFLIHGTCNADAGAMCIKDDAGARCELVDASLLVGADAGDADAPDAPDSN